MDSPQPAPLPESRGHRYTVWITSLENVDHVVTDEENATAARDNRGTRHAICGTEFRPAAMATPPGWTCRNCLTICQVQARAHRARQISGGAAARASGKRGRRLVPRLLRPRSLAARVLRRERG